MPEFPCDHRGPILSTELCILCGGQEKPIDVHSCQRFGECTIQSNGGLREGRTATGALLHRCMTCDARTVGGVNVGQNQAAIDQATQAAASLPPGATRVGNHVAMPIDHLPPERQAAIQAARQRMLFVDPQYRPIFVAGFPSAYGGADTELDHMIDLWRSFGVPVVLVPMTNGLPDPQIAASVVARGCKIARYRPGVFAGQIVVSFCNGEFLKRLVAEGRKPPGDSDGRQSDNETFRHGDNQKPPVSPSERLIVYPASASRPRCVVWVNCMTWNFPDEIQAHAAGLIDCHAFHNDYQRSMVAPALEATGVPVAELTGYRPFFNVDHVMQQIRFAPRDSATDGYFGIGRISRDDAAKFPEDLWRTFAKVNSPPDRPVKAFILGLGDNARQKCGATPPCNWLDWMTWGPGGTTARDLYSRIHVLIHKTGGSRENWPRTIIEAMAAGVAVIAEDAWALREMIENGVTGFLCKSSDEMSFRASQLAFDEPLRQRMVQAAYARFLDEHANRERSFAPWRGLLRVERPVAEGRKPPGECVEKSPDNETCRQASHQNLAASPSDSLIVSRLRPAPPHAAAPLTTATGRRPLDLKQRRLAPRTPIFVVNRDRFDVCHKLVDWLAHLPGADVHILDNDSTFPLTLAWYGAIDSYPGGNVHVHRLGENLGPRNAFAQITPAMLGDAKHFVLTDSDLDLSACPVDLLDKLRDWLEADPALKKVGVSLRLDDLPGTQIARTAREVEAKYWTDPATVASCPRLAAAYQADIDTTLAMYRVKRTDGRPPCARWTGYGPSVRLAPPYAARHVPWYHSADRLPLDEKWYLGRPFEGTFYSARMADSSRRAQALG